MYVLYDVSEHRPTHAKHDLYKQILRSSVTELGLYSFSFVLFSMTCIQGVQIHY